MWKIVQQQKLKIAKTLRNSMNIFLFPSQRYEKFQYLLLNQKVYLLGSFPSSNEEVPDVKIWKTHESESACFPVGAFREVKNQLLMHLSHKVLYNYYFFLN